ncbi:MAG: PEP-CTERM sorting domain-containing protein [Chthonomonadales bacterium]
MSILHKCARAALISVVAFSATGLVNTRTEAQLTLTAAGVLRGFTLSTFATGFSSSSSVGPLGIGFNGDGTVLVTDFPGAIHKFPSHADGQVASAGNLVSSNAQGTVIGIARSGANLYVSDQTNGTLKNLSAGGIVGSVVVSGMPSATGVTANPTNGHIFVSTLGNNVIWDVDPVAATKTNFLNQTADGLSTDGTNLFMESNNHILGYRISDKALIFDSGTMGCAPDGTELGSGTLAGYIYVNCNNGQFFEVNLTTNSQVAIADSGSRGDFVSTDPTNGTLLITQTDRVIRLTAPKGGGFGQTPEPGVTVGLAGLGVMGAGLLLRRRRK